MDFMCRKLGTPLEIGVSTFTSSKEKVKCGDTLAPNMGVATGVASGSLQERKGCSRAYFAVILVEGFVSIILLIRSNSKGLILEQKYGLKSI